MTGGGHDGSHRSGCTELNELMTVARSRGLQIGLARVSTDRDFRDLPRAAPFHLHVNFIGDEDDREASWSWGVYTEDSSAGLARAAVTVLAKIESDEWTRWELGLE